MTAHRGRISLLPLLLTALIVACGPASGAGEPPPSAPAGGLVITAANIAFDRNELDVPADKAFQLLFENREGAPHNVRIYGTSVDQALFVGEVFGGPGSRAYDVPPLPAGSYSFRCDVHPDMAGTVVAK